MRARLFLFAIAVAGSVLPACHATSSSGGGTPDGVYCQAKIAGETVCYGYTNLAQDESDAVKQACTQSLGGTTGDSCPSGQIGCCTYPTGGYETTECYYVGTASSYQEGCGAEGGKWSAGGSGGGGGGGIDGGASDSGGPAAPPTGADSGTSFPPSGGQDSGVTPVGPNGCGPGLTQCPSGCVDLQSDPNNCGSCEYACSDGDAGAASSGTLASVPTCQAGVCGLGCSDPTLTACTDSEGTTYCDNLQSSKYSCGMCNHECSATVTSACLVSTCENGACSPGEPDPTKNGEACDDNGGSICGNGECLTPSASCTFENGQWQLSDGGETSEIGATCTCNGNSLASATTTVATCTACVTVSATSVLCLQ